MPLALGLYCDPDFDIVHPTVYSQTLLRYLRTPHTQ